MAENLKYRSLPAMSKLFCDLMDGIPSALELFSDRFRETTAVRAAVSKPRTGQDELSEVLLEYNRRLDAPQPVLDNVRALGKSNAFAVVTGQQAGLLGGPAYTVFKALTAVRLAQQFSRAFPDLRFVPVFWIEDDDDDLAEVTTLGLFSPEDEPVTLGPLRREHLTPVGRTPVDGEVIALLEQAVGLLPQGPGRSFIEDLSTASYKQGETLSTGFARFMTGLLGGQGVVMLSAHDRAFKSLSCPVLSRLVAENEIFQKAVLSGSDRMKSAGYKLQVAPRPNRAGLFALVNDQRTPVTVEGDQFVMGGTERLTVEALQRLMSERPAEFSPDVLCRPLVQDGALPTAAFVGGPHEIAYHAQIASAYDALGIVEPALYPRASLTLVDRSWSRWAESLGLDAPAVVSSPQEAERMAARLPSGQRLLPAFENARQTVRDVVDRFTEDALALDPALDRAVSKANQKIAYHIERLANLTQRALRQKRTPELDQYDRLCRVLLPNGGLQERHINLCHFIARSGPEVIDRIKDAVDPDLSGHTVLKLE